VHYVHRGNSNRKGIKRAMLMLEATLGDFAKVVADACQTERATLAAHLAEAERLLREWDEKPEMRDTDHDKWEEAWHERREAFLDRIDGDGEVGG
jgi:hypothetical protein